MEAGGALYVFDKGTLTSFDAATGQVHWRLTSAGISLVQPDGKGNLYVTSTTASPDAIQFSQRVNSSSRANPVILKVDAATGRGYIGANPDKLKIREICLCRAGDGGPVEQTDSG